MVGRPFTRQQTDQNLNIKASKTILTGEQHTNHIDNGQRVSRHSLPTLLYFLFSPPHIFLIQFYCHRTNGTFGFARHTI